MRRQHIWLIRDVAPDVVDAERMLALSFFMRLQRHGIEQETGVHVGHLKVLVRHCSVRPPTADLWASLLATVFISVWSITSFSITTCAKRLSSRYGHHSACDGKLELHTIYRQRPELDSGPAGKVAGVSGILAPAAEGDRRQSQDHCRI